MSCSLQKSATGFSNNNILQHTGGQNHTYHIHAHLLGSYTITLGRPCCLNTAEPYANANLIGGNLCFSAVLKSSLRGCMVVPAAECKHLYGSIGDTENKWYSNAYSYFIQSDCMGLS